MADHYGPAIPADFRPLRVGDAHGFIASLRRALITQTVTHNRFGSRRMSAEDIYPKSGSWMIARWRRIGGNHRDGDRNDGSGGSPGG